MGMFDKTYGAKAYTPASLAAEAGQGIADLAGGAFGMEHKESAVINVMKTVNPDDLTSVIDGFKQILEIDPNAAQEYKDQMMPFVEARQQQVQVDTARAKTRQAKQYQPTDMEKKRDVFYKNIKANNPNMPEQEIRNLALEKATTKTYDPGTKEQDLFSTFAADEHKRLAGGNEQVKVLDQLLGYNENLTSGMGWGEIKHQANRALEVFGFQEDAAADAQVFDSMVTNQLIAIMQKAPGIQTDADEDRFRKTLVSRAGTQAGNKAILEYQKNLILREQAQNFEMSQWSVANKTSNTPSKNTLDHWKIHLNKWRKENDVDFTQKNKDLENIKPVATKKKKFTDTDVANAMKNLNDGTSTDKPADIQAMFNKVVPESAKPTQVDLETKKEEEPGLFDEYWKQRQLQGKKDLTVPRKIERSPAIDPSVSQLSSFLNTNYDVPMEAPGMLTQTEANTVDAFLAKQQMNRPVLEEIREVALAEAPTKTPTTPKEARVGGKDITTMKKVNVFRMTPAEKKEWVKFVGSIPVDANGRRPKGWSMPFKKRICKNRPECKL